MNSVWIPSFKETGLHSFHRRSVSHDYYAPFIYHNILKKRKECEDFGQVAGDARIAPGKPGCAFINESHLGRTISKGIIHLPYRFPIIKLHQFCVMPDHVHLLIQVLFRSDKHLDFYMEELIRGIAHRYSKLVGREISEADIFEPGYCDKPLFADRNLNNLYSYIRQNPHRLAMRLQFPHFFERIHELPIGGRKYEAYGNAFLFRNPDKAAVKISRSFTPAERQSKRTDWVTASAHGTVLVSPFISPHEKAIRSEAESMGAKLILITHEAFGERYKPAAHDFELCAQGRLSLISLGMPKGTPISYGICSVMNSLAAEIAGM